MGRRLSIRLLAASALSVTVSLAAAAWTAPEAPLAIDSAKITIAGTSNVHDYTASTTKVRVTRAKYGPHEKGVMHEHVLDRVVTFITDGNMKVTTPEGETKMLKASAGDVITGGQAKHIEENLSDKPFEVVVVEFKK